MTDTAIFEKCNNNKSLAKIIEESLENIMTNSMEKSTLFEL